MYNQYPGRCLIEKRFIKQICEDNYLYGGFLSNITAGSLFAIKSTCEGIGLLISGSNMQACPAKWEIEEKAEAIMRHGHRLGVFFMASYYVFIALAGALLVTRKLNIVYYFCVIVLFNLIQAGIFILIKFINTYGGTELLNRVYAIVYQKLTVAVLVIPLFIVAGRYVFAQISASSKD